MPVTDTKQSMVARQQLKTLQLLGVDFIPTAAPEQVCAENRGEDRDDIVRAVISPVVEREVPDSQTIQPPAKTSGNIFTLAEPLSPELHPDQKQAALDALREEHEHHCPHCTTAEGHTRLVFGEGNPDARLMFVGEAPGETEDQSGRPFVGRAGQKLEEMIKAMKLRREDVYIANVLKARPPGNRTPLQSEIERCGPYLARQIRIIRPSVLVALGGPAAKMLLAVETGITRLRGIWGSYNDGDLTVRVMPTFHPAYLLRNYTADTRMKVWSDLQMVMAELGIVL